MKYCPSVVCPAALKASLREPQCRMGVLPAVFPEAGAIAAYIAGVAPVAEKRGIEELNNAVFAVKQQPERGIERGIGLRVRGLRAEAGPALRDGVYAAALVLPCAEFLAVGPVAAQIPLPVPRPVGRPAYIGGKGAVFVRIGASQLDEQIGKALDTAGEKPAEPHAFAEDVAHAVVPVAAAEAQKSVTARAAHHAAVNCALRVHQHALRAIRTQRCFIAILFIGI